MPAIVFVGIGILGIYVLYTTPFVTVQQTPSPLFWDLIPPPARRIGTLMISLFAFMMMLLMSTEEWSWQTRPISSFLNINARAGLLKSFGIWLLAVLLASGLDMMLQPYAKVNAFELGLIVGSCIVVYDVMIFWEMLRDVVKHMLFSLLFLVTIVNLFVTVPVAVPFRELIPIGVGASLIDFFASYGVRRIMAHAKIQTRSAASIASSTPTLSMKPESAERVSLSDLIELIDQEFSAWHWPRSPSFYLICIAVCGLGLASVVILQSSLYVGDRQFSIALMSSGFVLLAVDVSYVSFLVTSGALHRTLADARFRRICTSAKFKPLDTPRNKLLIWALISLRGRLPITLAEAMEGSETLFQDETTLLRDAVLREAP
jgi:hypothetical protein